MDTSPHHSTEYVSLKEYIDTRIASLDKATDISHRNLERRLDTMNEFREALKDQSITFLTKAEYCVFKEQIDDDIRSLMHTRSVLEGKASQSSVNVSLMIGITGLFISLVSLILRFLGI